MNTVLVTGVGAIIGYGLLNTLRDYPGEKLRLLGTDIYSDAVGQDWSDTFEIAPLTSSERYLPWLTELVAKHEVDLIIPGIEQDLHFYSDHRDVFESLGVVVVLNDQKLVDVTKDKWRTFKALEEIDSPCRIDSSLESEFDVLASRFGLPFLLKPRRSYASKGLVTIHSELEFRPHSGKLGKELMAQPLVGDDDHEYTVGIFGDGQGSVSASITLKRRLAIDGSTAKASVEMNTELDDLIRQLCEYFKPIGPTNFQFRGTSEGWKLLEINPRVSSSTSLRAAFGYNESRMCVDFFLKNQVIEQPRIRRGFASRYIADRVVYDSADF